MVYNLILMKKGGDVVELFRPLSAYVYKTEFVTRELENTKKDVSDASFGLPAASYLPGWTSKKR